uniref:Mitochondrial inner membrane protein Mpv17 n=1 Tax=Globodera rostochiensis TaxID=31243 RepID=A0A914H0K2_GLORO
MATTATMPPIYLHKHFFRRIFPGKPFFIQIFSAGALAAVGDILCQKLFEKRDKWDPFRTSRFALTTAIVIVIFIIPRGILFPEGKPKPNCSQIGFWAKVNIFILIFSQFLAPIQFHWFRFMDRRIGGSKNTGPAGNKMSVRTGLKRVLADQSIIAPTLTAAFLFCVNFLDSFSAQSAVQRTKRIYFDVLVNNYKFWPFVQMINLTVIPLQFRVVFVQFFSIFWNIFLSFKTNN